MTEAKRSEETRDLVQRAQSGDPAAFGRLADRYRTRLLVLIGLRLGQRLRAYLEPEDVLQETYLRALRTIATFRWQGAGSFRGWLGGICEHVIRDQVRYRGAAKRRAGTLQDLDEEKVVADGVSPSRRLQREERFTRLERALLRLKSEHREVIILARIRGLPLKDVAREMKRPRAAVSQLLLRALRRLKTEFGTTDSLGLPSRRLGGEDSAEPPGWGVQRAGNDGDGEEKPAQG